MHGVGGACPDLRFQMSATGAANAGDRDIVRSQQPPRRTAGIAGLAFLTCIAWNPSARARSLNEDAGSRSLSCLFIDGKVYRLPLAQVMAPSSAIERCTPTPAASEVPAPQPVADEQPAAQFNVRVIRSAAAPACPCPKSMTSTVRLPAGDTAPQDWISAISREHGLDPKFVHALIHVESRHDPNARSPTGALGLMQIMPATAARYGVFRAVDLLDPVTNVQVGTQYLRHLSDLFDRRLELVVAAYNIGENRVMSDGYKVPQVAETQGYVRQVLTLYAQTP